MVKRGGRVARFFIEIFVSYTAEKIRRGSFTVSLISGTEKG